MAATAASRTAAATATTRTRRATGSTRRAMPGAGAGPGVVRLPGDPMNLTGIGKLWLDGLEVSGPLRYAVRVEQRGFMTRASGHIMIERHDAARIIERIDPNSDLVLVLEDGRRAGHARSRARTATSPDAAKSAKKPQLLVYLTPRLPCGLGAPMDSNELDEKIADLAASVKEPLFGGPRRDGQFWRGVWNQVREIGQAFRTTRYPTKADMDAAWSRYSAIVEDVKRQQEEHHRERKSREEQSQRLLAEILAKAQAACPPRTASWSSSAPSRAPPSSPRRWSRSSRSRPTSSPSGYLRPTRPIRARSSSWPARRR